MTFSKWLDTLIQEKQIDVDRVLTVQGPSGPNFMPIACVIEAIKGAPASERAAIKTMIVRLDFANAPIVPYLQHLAQAIAQ